MRKFALILLGALSLAALDASGAAAAKMKMHPRHGHIEEEESGDVVLASSNLAFTTAAGTLNCAKSEMSGQLAAFEGANSIALEIFNATASGKAGPGSACASNFAQGPAVFTASGLPRVGEFTDRGAFELKGQVGFRLVFPDDPGVECGYATKKLKSTYTAGSPGKPARVAVSTSAQKLTRSKAGSSSVCPKTGKLSATWKTNLVGEVEP